MAPLLPLESLDADALRLRSDAGLHPEDVVPDIVTVIEQLGVPVAVLPFGRSGPDGLYVRGRSARLILLNGSKYLPRLRYTAAHELGHAHYDDEPHLDQDIEASKTFEERRADAFAARFLMSRPALWARRSRYGDIGANEALALASEFGVSYRALVYRMNNVNLIAAKRREALLRERPILLTEELQTLRPASGRRLPTDYIQRAIAAYERYDIALSRVAELLEEDPDTLRPRLKAAGILHEEDE
jgi:Zn-dependent peptidase ImmA (M78 family)